MCGNKIILILSFLLDLTFTKFEDHKSKFGIYNCETWGPGLSPAKLVFPARYFFVKLKDKFGNTVSNLPSNYLNVNISGSDSGTGTCKVWSDILSRKDGIYIVRYKLYNSCHKLKIDLKLKNTPIWGFPKLFTDTIYADDCYCPQDINRWLKNMECPHAYSQITADLEMFTTINFSNVRKKILKKFIHQRSVSLCHYAVKENKIFRKCYGTYVDFKLFMDAILNSLTRKVYLPDFEFFVNLGDWPLVEKSSDPLPIFSWCKSNVTSDILMPTYDLTEATLECMGRVTRDMLSVQGNTGVLWKNKINKAFWRGRDSNIERLHLIKLSKKHPDMINASLTNFFFFRGKENQFGPKVDPVPFYDFFKYKYQLNLDGTVAAYRLPFLLAGDSVVMKQESSYFEHFYRHLIPYEHYVPVKRDLSDLIQAIKWLRDNDDVAEKIAKQGQEFATNNLLPKDVLCYYAVLFKEWSKRLLSTPKVSPEMENVFQEPPKFPCTCKNASVKDEL